MKHVQRLGIHTNLLPCEFHSFDRLDGKVHSITSHHSSRHQSNLKSNIFELTDGSRIRPPNELARPREFFSFHLRSSIAGYRTDLSILRKLCKRKTGASRYESKRGTFVFPALSTMQINKNPIVKIPCHFLFRTKNRPTI